MSIRTTWEKLYRAVGTLAIIEVTRTIEQEDFEGWLKNRLLGGS